VVISPGGSESVGRSLERIVERKRSWTMVPNSGFSMDQGMSTMKTNLPGVAYIAWVPTAL